MSENMDFDPRDIKAAMAALKKELESPEMEEAVNKVLDNKD